MSDWISVEDRLPELSTPLHQVWVLVYAPDDDWSPLGHIHIGLRYEHSGWRVTGSNGPRRITHWMPAPEAPR